MAMNNKIFGFSNIIVSFVLAILTWAVLWYFEVIEDERSDNFEKSADATLVETCYGQNYDVYFNFFWIFACIYVLTKVTALTERYIGERKKSEEDTRVVDSINSEWERTLEIYETEKQRLAQQIDDLRNKNINLEKVLNEIKAWNMALMNENYRKSTEQERSLYDLQGQYTNDANPYSTTKKPSNVYITNRHIHLTRQVFVNEGSINLNIRKTGGEDFFMEPSQVWIKYLKMRKHYVGPIADPGPLMGDSRKADPLVVSTEQLQILQGI